MVNFPPSLQKEWLADCESAQTHAPKNHGRCETRTIHTSTWSVDRIKEMGWLEVEQIFELTRVRSTSGKESTCEVVYGFTSLCRVQAGPERLMELCRGHWGIENELHYVRDVTLGEDQSRIRKGHSPKVMACLRNIVVQILTHRVRSGDCRTRPDAIRDFQLNPQGTLEKLNAL